MSIKGTLETFNLRELLQMLAFNQKVGTLVLETSRGTQTIHVDKGRVAFVEGDAGASEALLRVFRRRKLLPEDRIERTTKLYAASGQYVGYIVRDLGALEEDRLREAIEASVSERFLRLQLTSITRFEFADGQVLAPDGTEKWPDGRARKPIEPGLVVEGLLLDLTRKMDQWAELTQIVPTTLEVYEGTGISVDVANIFEEEEVDATLADPVVQAIDGCRPLEQVVDASDVDDLTVLQIVSALVQGGGLRPVSTPDLLVRGEDLLSRGDAERALPLLGRVVDRGDGPAEARLHLADALELTGHAQDAAAQLDAYAELADESKPVAVFDAMHRALELRGGDLATACRTCDFYLANRPWLHERTSQAVEALRSLIHAAVSARQPLMAAERLHPYIQNGDVPSEDLIALADLYQNGGDRIEAASALYHRAEDLLTANRVPEARELLRRSLQLDGSRTDARSRLHLLEGEQRRKRHRKRVAVTLTLLGLILLGGTAAWWTYTQEAGRSIRRVRDRAERAVTKVRREIGLEVESFTERLAEAREAEEPDDGLGDAASTLLEIVEEEATSAEETLLTLAKAIDQYQATNHGETNAAVLSHLKVQLSNARHEAEALVEGAKAEGRTELKRGETDYATGRFLPARSHLKLARNLSFDDEAVRSRSNLLLQHVERYVEAFEQAKARVDSAREDGNVRLTFERGVDLLAHQLDSDLTRDILLPVQVDSTPRGAAVWLQGKPTGLTTPCTLEYSPFAGSSLYLRLPGRVPHRFTLPDFEAITDETSRIRAWEPSLHATLPEGPRWTIPREKGPFAAIWTTQTVPLLLREDGQTLQPVLPDTGALSAPKGFGRSEAVRLGGTLGSGTEWRIVGHRTLIVRPPTGEAWEVQVLGRLERAPVLTGALIAVIDERGDVYGFDVLTGRRKWRRTLACAPVQPLHVSHLGLLASTADGDAYVIHPESGAHRLIASSARELLLALPLGEEVALLGGTSGEARVLKADGTLERVGEAKPLNAKTWTTFEGVAWIGEDGVHWLGRNGGPVHVTGLGPQVSGIAGSKTELYGLGEDGVLRASALSGPTLELWRCDVGGTTATPPFPLGDTIYLLIRGGLTAVAR